MSSALPAILYFALATALAWVAHRFVRPLSRRAAAMLILLPLCFTRRALLTGRIYGPVEMPWAAQPLADHRVEYGVGPPHAPVLGDIAYQMIPWREALQRSLADRQWPLLNRFESCGDVLASSAQPAAFSPFTLVALLMPAALSFSFTASITFFLAALGAFLFARELGCSDLASSAAAVIWALSAPIALQILWPLGFAWALLPLVLMATKRVIDSPGPQSIAILTAALVLDVLAGHPETLLHVVAVGCVFGVFELLAPGRERHERVRALAALVVAGVLTLLLSAIQIVPFLDAVSQTFEHHIRGDLYARAPLQVDQSFQTAALLTNAFPFLRPHFGLASILERGEAGSIALALAIFAVVHIRSRQSWFFGALFVLTLLAGARVWPVAQALHRLPLFDVALNDRLLAVVPLCLAMLAALAIDRLSGKGVAAIAGAVAVAFAVAALIAGAGSDRLRLYADLVPPIIAAAVLLLPLRRTAAAVILITLVIAQRTVADGTIVPVNPLKIAYPRLEFFEPMNRVTEPFRIAAGNSLLPNTATMYGIEDVRGSSPITFEPLAETFPLWLVRKPGAYEGVPDLRPPMLGMMNVRFAILDVSDPIPPGWHDAGFDTYTRLIENEHVLPRAFVPRHVRIGVPADREIEQMKDETDFAERAWLQIDDREHERSNGPGEAAARWRGSDLDLDVAMKEPGFVVISQAAWRGWRAYLDGRRVSLHRANHAYLAVWVPAGRHSIRLRFLPQSFVLGRSITFATAAMLLIGAIALRWKSRRDPRAQSLPSS